MFSCDLAITLFPVQHQEVVQAYLDKCYTLFLNKLNLMVLPLFFSITFSLLLFIFSKASFLYSSLFQEENGGGGVSEILINVLEILPGANRHLGFCDLVKMNCTRCKMDTEYPPVQPSFGIFIVANSLRETKA